MNGKHDWIGRCGDEHRYGGDLLIHLYTLDLPVGVCIYIAICQKCEIRKQYEYAPAKLEGLAI